MLLSELPIDHKLRNRPCGGLYHRWHCWQGDTVIAHEAEYWGVSSWKRIPPIGDSAQDMPIAKYSYNELEALGGFWTESSDWCEDKTLHPKIKNE